MNDQFKIESNIPIPGKLHAKYPFASMKVGDSFYAAGCLKPARRSSLSSCCVAFAKRNKVKFTTRREGDGVRVWRVA